MSYKIQPIALALILSFSPFIYASDDHDDHHDGEHQHEQEFEKVAVQATRSGRIADDSPIRVEIINAEEIGEKAAMRPGNISMLMAETGGVRVQTTSPALGSANVRLQGLYGRYTQLLADGLPLYGNQAASIGLLQIPPTDLGRVEIIKGSASSLYGGSALGGVINLVSRRPGDEFNGEALINLTGRDGQDFTSYFESPLGEHFKVSLTAGAHHQSEQDVDGDGWIDLAGYERYTARPRLFWEGEKGETLYATVGFMNENRTGGFFNQQVFEDAAVYNHSQQSERFDAGLAFSMPVGEDLTFSTRASSMKQEHSHGYGDVVEDDKHHSYLLETSLAGFTDKSDWVIGAALQTEHFDSQTFGQFNYRHEVPGLFAQYDYEHNDEVTTTFSARVDDHNKFGTQFSPRISVLYSPGDLTVRGSIGQGYFAPTPFVEEIEAAGLSRLQPIDNLQREQAQTASLDFTYKFDNFESSITVFGSNVDNVTKLVPVSTNNNGVFDGVRLVNALGESKIYGSEMLLRYHYNDIKLTASYLHLDTSEVAFDGTIPNITAEQQVALTPKHSAGFVAMWERHGEFRAGFEAYYTGVQRLNDNPFAERSKPYWHLGLMGEITIGRASWFVNLENLLDVKQTDEHPMLLPMRAPSGAWTTDIWSRNDGFIVNAGVRIKFGG